MRFQTPIFRLLIAGLLATLMIGGARLTQSQEQAYIDPQTEPYARLMALSERPASVHFRPGGFPGSIMGSFPVTGETALKQARSFIDQHRTLLLQNDADLGLITRTTTGFDDISDHAVVFEQTYRGVKVYGAQLVVTMANNRVLSSMGALLTSLDVSGIAFDTMPTIMPNAARQQGLSIINQPGAVIPADPELLIYAPALVENTPDSQPRLVWRLRVAQPVGQEIFIDAHTGELVQQFSTHQHVMDLDLQSAHGTESGSTGCYWWTTANEAIGDEEEMYDGWKNHVDGVQARSSALFAYHFYNDTFGYDSFDDDNMEVEVFVDASIGDAAGRWVPGYGCDLIEINDGDVADDIITHEYTHGVIEYRDLGNLKFSGQSRETEEAFADIMAALADNNWTIGESRTGSSNVIHDLFDPTNTDQNDRWSTYNPDAAGSDDPYENNGILGKAAYLTTNGGIFNTYSLNGIGLQKARALFYVILMQMPNNVDFMGVRDLAVSTASAFAYANALDLPFLSGHGFTEQDVCEVRNAFAAVELGGGDRDCDGVEEPNPNDPDGDSISGNQDNCPGIWNPSQADWDGDGMGQACDPVEGIDEDGDGVPTQCLGGVCSLPDNCPAIYNPDQQDANFNGVGDACDPTADDDFDDDGIHNGLDNCFLDYNPDQADVDNDGDGDACDPDGDGDGISNDDDNCPFVANSDQANSDYDSLGDACDACPETDDMGVAVGYFENPITGEVYAQEIYDDVDGDGIPDSCDPHTDIIRWEHGGSLFADCETRQMIVTAAPASYASLALRHYGNTAANLYPRDARLVLTLDGLPDTVRTWIDDTDGRSWDASNVTGTRELDLRPLGGQRYHLMFNFSPEIPAGTEMVVNAVLRLEIGGQTMCLPRPNINLDSTPDIPLNVCEGFVITDPRSRTLANGTETFFWNAVPGANNYRITIYNRDGGAQLFMATTPNTNAVLDISSAAIGGGNRLIIRVTAFADQTELCQAMTTLDRMPPAETPQAIIPTALPELMPTLTVTPVLTIPTQMPTATPVLTIPTQEPISTPNIIRPVNPITFPVCGNNICEVGEGDGVCCTDCNSDACIE